MALSEKDKKHISHINAVFELSSLVVNQKNKVFYIEDENSSFDGIALDKFRQSLTQDLLNLTQNYQYRLDDFGFYMIDIYKMMYSKEMSNELVMHFFNLFYNGKLGRQYYTIIEALFKDVNLELSLFVLTQPVEHDDKLEFIIDLFRKAQATFPQEEEKIHQAFIKHMQLNFKFDDVTLIESYKKLFWTRNASLFLSEMKKDEANALFPSHTHQDFSICQMDKKQLMIQMKDLFWISGISRRIEEGVVDFPKFYTISENQDYYLIGIEKSEEKVLEKFQYLVKCLIEQNYDYTQDYKNNWVSILSIVEKVKLEFHIKSKESQKLSQKI